MLRTTVSVQGFTLQLIYGFFKIYFLFFFGQKYISNVVTPFTTVSDILADVFWLFVSFLDRYFNSSNCAFDLNYMEKGQGLLCSLVDPLKGSINFNSFGN